MKKIIILIFILILTSCRKEETTEVKGVFVEENIQPYYLIEPTLEQKVEKKTTKKEENLGEYEILGIATFYSNINEAKELALNGDSYACEYLAQNDDWIKWTIRGAALGNPVCMYNLGELYEFGNDMETNISEAIYWYKKSADLNYSESYYKLGYFYLQGTGVEKNYYLAYDYLYKGAGAGSSNAMIALGAMFEKGLGVEQNFNTAAKWYQLSNSTSNKLNQLYVSNKKNIDVLETNKIVYKGVDLNVNEKIIDNQLINTAKKYLIANNYAQLFKTFKSDFGLKENLVEVNGLYQDGYYLDIDGDGIKEVLSTIKDEVVILKLIDETFEEIQRFDVVGEKSGLIKFNGRHYYLTSTKKSYENKPTELIIYAFGENGIEETCKILQTVSSDSEQFQKVTGESNMDYYMETILKNYKNRTIESGILYEDIDNNGYLEKIKLDNVNVDSINTLFLNIYGYENVSNTLIEKFLKEFNSKHDDGYLTQIYIENIDGLNYIFLLYEGYNTYLYCYLLDNDVNMISNYISYNLYDIQVEIEKF